MAKIGKQSHSKYARARAIVRAYGARSQCAIRAFFNFFKSIHSAFLHRYKNDGRKKNPLNFPFFFLFSFFPFNVQLRSSCCRRRRRIGFLYRFSVALFALSSFSRTHIAHRWQMRSTIKTDLVSNYFQYFISHSNHWKNHLLTDFPRSNH